MEEHISIEDIKTEDSTTNGTEARDALTKHSYDPIYSENIVPKLEPIWKWSSITWICFYCNVNLNDYKALKFHLQCEHEIIDALDTYYECSDCNEFLLGYASFINHVRRQHYETLKLCCDECNEILPDYEQLSVHRDKHIEFSNNFPILYQCSLCEIVQPTEKELNNHVQITHKIKNIREDVENNQGSSINFEEKSKNSSSCSKEVNHLAETIHCEGENNENAQIFGKETFTLSLNNKADLNNHVLQIPNRGDTRPQKSFKKDISKKKSANYKLKNGMSCCIEDCRRCRRYDDNVRLFRFPPKDTFMGQIWRRNCGILEEFCNLNICDRHFKKSDIGKRFLKKTAVPLCKEEQPFDCVQLLKNVALERKRKQQKCIKCKTNMKLSRFYKAKYLGIVKKHQRLKTSFERLKAKIEKLRNQKQDIV